MRTFAPGARLSARVLDGGHGAEIFIELFDTELGIPCWFVSTGLAEIHCLPTSGEALYVDDACQQPAVSVGCEGPLAATVFDHSSGCDGTPTEVFVPTGEPAFTSERIDAYGADCSPQGEQRSITTAERLPLERFVRGYPEDVDLGGGAGVRRIVADDGTMVVIDFLRDGRVCEPAMVGGSFRCRDVHTASLGPEPAYFEDPSCQGQPLAQVGDQGCGEKPPLLAVAEGGECAADSLFSLGDPVRSGRGGYHEECTEVADVGLVRVGPELGPDDLPAMDAVERGTDRLVVRSWEIDAIGVAAPRSPGGTVIRDTLLGVDCTPHLTADGQMRCTPVGSGLARDQFADEGCSTPLFVADFTDCGEIIDNRAAAVSPGAGCLWTMGEDAYDGVIAEVWERGEPYQGPVYQRGEFGGCTPVEEGSPRFAVGTIHPVEDFALFDLRP